jgi:hypothetical protein
MVRAMGKKTVAGGSGVELAAVAGVTGLAQFACLLRWRARVGPLVGGSCGASAGVAPLLLSCVHGRVGGVFTGE